MSSLLIIIKLLSKLGKRQTSNQISELCWWRWRERPARQDQQTLPPITTLLGAGHLRRWYWYHSKSFRLIPIQSQLHENLSHNTFRRWHLMKQIRLLIFWWLIYGFQQIQKLPFVNSALPQHSRTNEGCWWYMASNGCSLQSSAVGYASPTSTSINWNSLKLMKSEDLEP